MMLYIIEVGLALWALLAIWGAIYQFFFLRGIWMVYWKEFRSYPDQARRLASQSNIESQVGLFLVHLAFVVASLTSIRITLSVSPSLYMPAIIALIVRVAINAVLIAIAYRNRNRHLLMAKIMDQRSSPDD